MSVAPGLGVRPTRLELLLEALAEPGIETDLAEDRAIAGNRRALTQAAPK